MMVLCDISGFCRGIVEVFTFLVCSTGHRLAIHYQCFGTAYESHLQGSRSPISMPVVL